MNSIIIKHNYVLELLEDILNQSPPTPTDLLICSTRQDFLRQILLELDQHSLLSQQETASPQQEDVAAEHEKTTSSGSDSILLARTLNILNASQYVRLIFCPTLTVLRGYVSGFISDSTHSSQSPGPLIIVNLLALHHGTSEFTLQGLSQTFATAVSAAHRTTRILKLVECKDSTDPSNLNRGSALWQTEVQLLSAAIKIGQMGQNWGRRSISVARIASRWFKMEEGAQTHEGRRRSTGPGRPIPEDEMLV